MLFTIFYAVILLAAGFIYSWFLANSITNSIKRIIKGLSKSSEHLAFASNQISSGSQIVAEGTSEQAASVEETSSSLEEMTALTNQNAENAGYANDLMADVNKLIANSNESMSQLTSSMANISKSSEEMSKIIKTIDEISFQTNLLALNAAVEAARAGEAGAGFAVVADEVRNLAMRAAEAAKNRSDLIESSVKNIKDGAALVNTTNDDFIEVAQNANKVGDLVTAISEASKKQALGIDQVNKSVSKMDKVVQQNSATAEESASSSGELNTQAEHLKGYVRELLVFVGANNIAPHSSVDKRLSLRNKNLKQQKGEVVPNQIIPMDDDFTNF